MKYTIDNAASTSILTVIDVAIKNTDITAACNVELQRIGRNVNLKGFRKGKVPLSNVERIYGKSVKKDVQYRLMHRAFLEIATECRYNILGEPKFTTPEEHACDGITSFTVECELFPLIESVNFKDIDLPVVEFTPTDEDVTDLTKELLERNGVWTKVTGEQLPSDRITINYHCTIDGKDFEGCIQNGFQFIKGSLGELQAVDDLLSTLTVGEEGDIEVAFENEPHVAAAMRGHLVNFHVALVAHERQEVLTEWNDALFKQFGVSCIGEVEDMIHAQIVLAVESDLAKKRGVIISDELLRLNPVELPMGAVKREVIAMQANEKNTHLTIAEVEALAHKRVGTTLLLDAIAKLNNIKVLESDIADALDECVADSADPDLVREQYLASPEVMGQLRITKHHKKVEEFILSQLPERESLVMSLTEVRDYTAA